MLRKYPVANTLASIFNNLEISKSYKIDTLKGTNCFLFFLLMVVPFSAGVRTIKQKLKKKIKKISA